MKVVFLAKILVSNVVVLAFIWTILQDDAGRVAYFQSLGFTTSTAYYPFFYITSAVSGSTHIPGLLTLDWVQLLAVALIVLDISFALPFMRRGRSLELSTLGPATAP